MYSRGSGRKRRRCVEGIGLVRCVVDNNIVLWMADMSSLGCIDAEMFDGRIIDDCVVF
jgi:hypothetical protein